MTEWISVSDKLPEKGQNVLTCGPRGSVETIHFRKTLGTPEYWEWKKNGVKHITHWMPLPELPND